MKNKSFIEVFNQEDIWISVQEIPKNTLFFWSMVYYMAKWWPELGFGNKIKKFVSHFKSGASKLYCNQAEIDQAATFLANKIVAHPNWALERLIEIKKWSKLFINNSSRLSSLDVAIDPANNILRQYKTTIKYNMLSQVSGAAMTWLTEARHEFVTKAGIAIVKEQIEKQELADNPIEVFNILTSSPKKSVVAQEEEEFLLLQKDIMGSKKIRDSFAGLNLSALKELISNSNDQVSRAIMAHFLKWQWLSFGYTGPVLELNYFLERWQVNIKSELDPAKAIVASKIKVVQLKRHQKHLLSRLRFSSSQLALLEFLQTSNLIKDYRKGAVYYGMFCYEKFFKTIADKMGVELSSVWSMDAGEIENYLSGRSFPSRDELEKRQTECTIYTDKKRHQIFTDKDGHHLISQVLKMVPKIDQVTEISGTPVCLGFAKGTVRIIEKAEDMDKMREGDILVSNITYPSLIPAMKKAAAIVTNVGGLICHAAIIAREFNIPCVVGTKIANKVLKDGDMVEVDANKGIIKLII